jgi:hypothetical protein
MADDIKIAVFENGELSVPVKGDGGNEAVLALSLDRLLVKVVKIPSEFQENPSDYLTGIFKALSPFPDEPITVSYEVIRETEDGRFVLAAALPEGSADDIAEALDEQKLNITRIDSSALGALRGAWPYLGIGAETSRRIVFIAGATCISMFVLDGDCPVVVRAISLGDDMKRETLRSLIEAESFAGPAELREIVIVGEIAESGVGEFAPVRKIGEEIDFLAGVAERSRDPASLNALPDSWREVLHETRFKSKFKKFVVGALVIWFAMLAVIIGIPKYYSYQTGKQKDIRKIHKARYDQVNEKKNQVEAVRNVSNYDKSALEALRVVAANIPENFVLDSWSYTKGDLLKFSGKVAGGDLIEVSNVANTFKDDLAKVPLSFVNGEDEDEAMFFEKVETPNCVKRNDAITFSYDKCYFKLPEEEE